MNEKRLYRSVTDKKITGLCGGIAEYFGMDPTLVRILLVILIFCTALFPVTIVYFIISAIVPENPVSTPNDVNYDFVNNNPDNQGGYYANPNPNDPNFPNNGQ